MARDYKWHPYTIGIGVKEGKIIYESIPMVYGCHL